MTTQVCFKIKQTFNEEKRARLRAVLLSGLFVADREHEEHLMVRAVAEFDLGHIVWLERLQQRWNQYPGLEEHIVRVSVSALDLG